MADLILRTGAAPAVRRDVPRLPGKPKFRQASGLDLDREQCSCERFACELFGGQSLRRGRDVQGIPPGVGERAAGDLRDRESNHTQHPPIRRIAHHPSPTVLGTLQATKLIDCTSIWPSPQSPKLAAGPFASRPECCSPPFKSQVRPKSMALMRLCGWVPAWMAGERTSIHHSFWYRTSQRGI